MNEKTARQITEMKKQTIGVEVEMNNITRQKAAKAAAEFSAPDATRIPPAATDTAPGRPGTQTGASGSSRRMFPLRDRMTRNANWSPRS